MPYEPNYRETAPLPPSETQAVTPYRPQSGTPVEYSVYEVIASDLGLNHFLSSAASKRLILTVVIAGVMLLLATIAFTPRGMAQFFHYVGHSIGFALSPVGIRIVAFTLLALIAVFLATMCLVWIADALVPILMIAGVVLACVSGFGVWFHTLSSGWVLVLGGAGIGLLGVGMSNFADCFKTYPLPTPPPARSLAPSPFPNARAATAARIHTGLGGSTTPSNGGGSNYKRQD